MLYEGLNKTVKKAAQRVHNNTSTAKRAFELMARDAALSAAFDDPEGTEARTRRLQRRAFQHLPAAILEEVFTERVFVRRISRLRVPKGTLVSGSFLELDSTLCRVDSLLASADGSPYLCVLQSYDLSPFTCLSCRLYKPSSFRCARLTASFDTRVSPVVCLPFVREDTEYVIKVVE